MDIKKNTSDITDETDENRTRKSWWDNFKSGWSNAFSMKVADDEFNESDLKLIDDIAKDIADRGMASPAIMFLVSVKPVSFLMAQGMHFIRPFLHGFSSDTTSKSFASRFMVSILISNPDAYARFSLLMENRESIELLITNLEKYEDERAKKLKVGKT
ncbi:hypothetical protein KKB99_05580 [bacterium]|nr:hypothetical protein [bacterium]MBU1025467.1 hypothetical protein [bacterium]